jgi:hypothetical protein
MSSSGNTTAERDTHIYGNDTRHASDPAVLANTVGIETGYLHDRNKRLRRASLLSFDDRRLLDGAYPHNQIRPHCPQPSDPNARLCCPIRGSHSWIRAGQPRCKVKYSAVSRSLLSIMAEATPANPKKGANTGYSADMAKDRDYATVTSKSSLQFAVTVTVDQLHPHLFASMR